MRYPGGIAAAAAVTCLMNSFMHGRQRAACRLSFRISSSQHLTVGGEVADIVAFRRPLDRYRVGNTGGLAPGVRGQHLVDLVGGLGVARRLGLGIGLRRLLDQVVLLAFGAVTLPLPDAVVREEVEGLAQPERGVPVVASGGDPVPAGGRS